MLVMKFGGASLKNASAIERMGKIIRNWNKEPLLIVVSAMGKTTNALDQIGNVALEGNLEEIERLTQQLIAYHRKIIEDLGLAQNQKLNRQAQDYFELARVIAGGICALGEYSPRQYARLVALGELLSSKIIAAYLEQIGNDIVWVDIRDYIKTDPNYRAAKVLFDETAKLLTASPLIPKDPTTIVITQGFIGSAVDNQTTTLGREGSDYTAAILANLLSARQAIFWKDVPGVMNADPDYYPEALLIPELNYEQAANMTFWGAKVIHHSAIEALASKNIPLQVRSFLTPETPGTVIQRCEGVKEPTRLLKQNQVLLFFRHKNLRYMDTTSIHFLFGAMANHNLPTYGVYMAELGIYVITEGAASQLNALQSLLQETYHCEMQHGLALHTLLNTDAEGEEAQVPRNALAALKRKTTVSWLAPQ
jgi:aspartate kinase